MKNQWKQAFLIALTLTIFALSTTNCNAQQISFRVDPTNAMQGSKVNPPALNWKVSISDNWNYNSPVRLGMEYEAFNYIGYQQWTFAKLDYDITITDDINLLPGIAISQIYHETTYSHDAYSYAMNLEAQYRLNNFLKASIQAERERATDISQTWRDSLYVGLIYYWNED